MRDLDLYLQYVDEICEQLNQKKFKTQDEAWKYFNYIKDEYISNLERALDEIFDDYCTENNLEWAKEGE